MTRRSTSSGFFSPPAPPPPTGRLYAHAATRRRSLPLAPSSGASLSAATWSRRETALLVQAWRDVAEHPASARESVDAFQTRLFLRFQEVTSDAADDVASIAGSECSMESVDVVDSSSTGSPSSRTRVTPRTRSQTAVVLRTYALRRMTGFITAYIAQQTMRTQQVQEAAEVLEPMDDDVQGDSPADSEAPVDWFALSRDRQIERFQAAGATSYIELDEHTYATILTTLELLDKCKQEKPSAVLSRTTTHSSSNEPASLDADTVAWTPQELQHVVTAWRDVHFRTPTRLPGADSLYARFLALNNETSVRSKPEVAAMKTALVAMHRVVSAFQHRVPTSGKLTRGTLRRQRQNWFALPLAVRQQAFQDARDSTGATTFVDITEDMYATISELVSVSSLLLALAANGTGDVGTDSPSSRRSSFGLSAIKLEDSASAVRLASQKTRSRQRETIDLVSDDDNECDGDGDHVTMEEDESVNASSVGDDVDMGDDASLSSDNVEQASVSDSSGMSTTTSSCRSSDAMLVTAEASARAASEAAAKLFADLKAESSTDMLKQKQQQINEEDDKDETGRPRQNSLKKQKLEHHHDKERRHTIASDPSEMAALLEKQARTLNTLVVQVQEDRKRERDEREKLLLAMRADQQGRDAVVELLRAEQDERRRDREERRQMLQFLLREQQELQRKQPNGRVDGGVDAKVHVKSA